MCTLHTERSSFVLNIALISSFRQPSFCEKCTVMSVILFAFDTVNNQTNENYSNKFAGIISN